MYDFDRVIDRQGSGCFKYDGLNYFYPHTELLPMWVADMDFAIAPQIIGALQKRLEHPIFGYNLRLPAFYEAVSHWQKKRFDFEVKRSWQICTPGVVSAIAISILALSDPGDAILIQTPVYPPFYDVVKAHQRRLLTNTIIDNGSSYQIDFEDLEAKLSQAKLFILCNPHNPLGKVWKEEDLRQIGELCKKHGVIIISDEIHADLVYKPYQHIPIASLSDFADFTITCVSPSKSFNLAGLGTAVAIIANDKIRSAVSELNMNLHTYMGNSFGITALTAAYTEGEDWLEALLNYLQQNRDLLLSSIDHYLPGAHCYQIEGTYLAWLDLRSVSTDDNWLFDKVVNQAKVALDPGPRFGSEGSGFMRLNFGCPRNTLLQGLEQLSSAFHKIKDKERT